MAVTWSGTAWTATTGYVAKTRVVNGGNVYICTVAGTSAGAGGPTGTAAAIVDGTCTWQYLGVDGGNVVAIAAELSTVPAAAQAQLLALAEKLCNATTWDTLVDDGRVYLAAHLATLSRMKGKGPMTAEAVGPLSASYANLTALAGTWGSTPYGAYWWQLTRLLPTALGAVP